MKIYSVTEPAFKPYGKVVTGYDTKSIMAVLDVQTPLPDGVQYEASVSVLENLPAAKHISNSLYGGMPVQFGYCNGHNTKLNCLEYHRSSEFNLGSTDFILLLAKEDQIEDGMLDTTNVKAFFCPAGTLIEVYATTLHYAPCSAQKSVGFKVLVALPKGTNGEKPSAAPLNAEDKTLWACNKWLLVHPDSAETAQGAVIGLKGENIDIDDSL